MFMQIHILGIKAGTASAAGYALSTVYNYLANARFTFVHDNPHSKSLPRFLTTALIGLAINQIVLVELLRIGVLVAVAQLSATLLVLLWNYFINATWTFGKRPRL
ncbi:GtrA family protein [Paraburkholderia fungorum]|uniref:GtrA family protein n=1 Tax=Paraburkholderia fungorum TaxID=134537 RepID=UPI0020A81DD1|nr:GtrA family protein [Paraburkholderia fungorum]